MKQTRMYVCTLEEFILVDVVTLLYMDEVNMHWKCCSLYTLATIEENGLRHVRIALRSQLTSEDK